MKEILQTIDWMQVISILWSAVLLPVLTYVGTQAADYAKAKRIDQYTDILYQHTVDAVKDIYETIVKDIKHQSDLWTEEKKREVKELAKSKAKNALTSSAYQALKAANPDFEEYLDGLVGSVLYDLKNSK